MRIFIELAFRIIAVWVFVLGLAWAAHAEQYEVTANVPHVFGVTVTEAQDGADYTMVLKAVDNGTTVATTVTATSGTAQLIRRNLPVNGREFTAAVYRDGEKIKDSITVYSLFNAIAYYPQNFLAAMQAEADLAGYSGTQQAAIRDLLEKTAVRLELAKLRAEVQDAQDQARRKEALVAE